LYVFACAYVCTFCVIFCGLRLCYIRSHSGNSHCMQLLRPCSTCALTQVCPTMAYIHLSSYILLWAQGPLNTPYFHFCVVSRHQTLHKCPCSYPVQIHDPNRTHALVNPISMVSSFDLQLAIWTVKKTLVLKWNPYMVRGLFCKHSRAWEETVHPTPNQSLCKAEPRHDHAVCILWV